MKMNALRMTVSRRGRLIIDYRLTFVHLLHQNILQNNEKDIEKCAVQKELLYEKIAWGSSTNHDHRNDEGQHQFSIPTTFHNPILSHRFFCTLRMDYKL